MEVLYIHKQSTVVTKDQLKMKYSLDEGSDEVHNENLRPVRQVREEICDPDPVQDYRHQLNRTTLFEVRISEDLSSPAQHHNRNKCDVLDLNAIVLDVCFY